MATIGWEPGEPACSKSISDYERFVSKEAMADPETYQFLGSNRKFKLESSPDIGRISYHLFLPTFRTLSCGDTQLPKRFSAPLNRAARDLSVCSSNV